MMARNAALFIPIAATPISISTSIPYTVILGFSTAHSCTKFNKFCAAAAKPFAEHSGGKYPYTTLLISAEVNI